MVHQHLNGHDFGYNCKNYPINKIFHNSNKTAITTAKPYPTRWGPLHGPHDSIQPRKKNHNSKTGILHTSFPIGYVAVVGWG